MFIGGVSVEVDVTVTVSVLLAFCVFDQGTNYQAVMVIYSVAGVVREAEGAVREACTTV